VSEESSLYEWVKKHRKRDLEIRSDTTRFLPPKHKKHLLQGT